MVNQSRAVLLLPRKQKYLRNTGLSSSGNVFDLPMIDTNCHQDTSQAPGTANCLPARPEHLLERKSMTSRIYHPLMNALTFCDGIAPRLTCAKDGSITRTHGGWRRRTHEKILRWIVIRSWVPPNTVPAGYEHLLCHQPCSRHVWWNPLGNAREHQYRRLAVDTEEGGRNNVEREGRIQGMSCAKCI